MLKMNNSELRNNIFLDSSDIEDPDNFLEKSSSMIITPDSKIISTVPGELSVNMEAYNDSKLDLCNSKIVMSMINNSTHFRNENALQNIEPNDPYLIIQQKITPTIINLQLKLGPMQPSSSAYHYPKTQRPTSESLLSFNPSWFERKLPDSSTQPRLWLSYSKYLNKAFCLYCMMFGATGNSVLSGSTGKLSESWARTGWDTWNNGSRDIKRHEESPQHRAAELAKVRALSTVDGIAAVTDITSNSVKMSYVPCEVMDKRNMVKALIDSLLFLAPLISDPIDYGTEQEGTVNKMIHLLAQYNSALLATNNQLRALADSNELNLTSNESQRRLASAICDTVSDRLSVLVRKRRSYSLVLETVPSADNTFVWLVVWIRYLIGDRPSDCDVAQSLLDVLVIERDSSGNMVAVESKVQHLLHHFSLDPLHLVGIAYRIADKNFVSSNAQRMYNGIIGSERLWPSLDTESDGKEMLNIMLTCGVVGCPRLNQCLGLVQSLSRLLLKLGGVNWLRQTMINESYDVNLTYDLSKVDEVMDLLVDRFEELIRSLTVLREDGHMLSPEESWHLNCILSTLQTTETRLSVSILRSAIGILRPTCTCTIQSGVKYLRLMKDRISQELDKQRQMLAVNNDWEEIAAPTSLKRQCTAENVMNNEVHAESTSLDNQEHIKFMENLERLVSEIFGDHFLQLLNDVPQFSAPLLQSSSVTASSSSSSSSSSLSSVNCRTVFQLAQVDSKSVIRETSDFIPIYQEYRLNSAAIKANSTIIASREEKEIISSSSSSSSSSTSVYDLVSNYLGPLRLLYEFTSFPVLLSVYKVLCVLPWFDRHEWLEQRRRVRQWLVRLPSEVRLVDQGANQTDSAKLVLHPYVRCGLLVASIQHQTNQLWYLPTEAIIDKFAATSSLLRRCLSVR